jgi:hypothetical protein
MDCPYNDICIIIYTLVLIEMRGTPSLVSPLLYGPCEASTFIALSLRLTLAVIPFTATLSQY